MINLSLSDVRIFLCATPIHMHCGFDTLMGLAQTVFDQDPLSGHLFLFFNRERNRVKILFWDQDGFCIWYKKLETEDAHIFGFTEIGWRAHNQHVSVVEAGRMVGISGKSGPRR
jgi:transposase